MAPGRRPIRRPAWSRFPLGAPRADETVTVTATNSGGSASASFTVTVVAAPVLTPPAPTVAPSLSGAGRVGTPMLADPGLWSGDPTPVLSFAWRRNGADISGATGAEYTPVAADDGADLSCAVTASNASGTALAITDAVRITYPAPVVAGSLADQVLDQGSGARMLDASATFTGAALVFGVAGAGTSIDPATGILSIPADTPRAGETATVTATNSGGSASSAFRVTVKALPVAPASLSAPSLAGTGRVGASMRVNPGVWSGEPTPVLSLRWWRNGVDIPGATGSDYVPVAADDGADLSCVVTASNAAGSVSAVTGAVRITRAAPVATGTIADRVLDQGTGAVTLDASAAFIGAALTFVVIGAGAAIDPATGVLSIPVGTPRAAETVTVTATNSGGSASSAFTVTVKAVVQDPAVGWMGPPRLVEGSLRSSCLALTLAAAPDVGGATITGYTLRWLTSPISDPADDEAWTEVASVPADNIQIMFSGSGFFTAQVRAETDAGSGPWGGTYAVAIPASAPAFRDTFTGTDTAKASSRPADIGGNWTDLGPSWLEISGNAAIGGGANAGLTLDGRDMRGAVMPAGYWTSDANGRVEITPGLITSGDRLTILFGYRDIDNFHAFRLRASSGSLAGSFVKMVAGVGSSISNPNNGGLTTIMPEASLITAKIEDDALTIAFDGAAPFYTIDLSGETLAGNLWGLALDQGTGASVDAISYFDAGGGSGSAPPDPGPDPDPSGAFVLTAAAPGITLEDV